MAKDKKTIVKGSVTLSNDKLHVVGIDVANSTIKVWTENDVHKVYRNTIKEVNDAGLVHSFKTNFQMYVVDNEVYEVGDLTVTGSGARGKARYGNKTFKIEALIGIASVLESNKPYRLRVVTGVPSYLAKNQEVINGIKQCLIGNYTIKSVLWDNHSDIIFSIEDVIVVPQPLGTIYNFIFDKETKKINEKMVEQRALVIDIGWGTTDIAILESGRVRSTFGFDIGTSDYISAIQEDVNNDMPKVNINSLSSHELDELLLKSSTVETPFGSFDLSAYPEKHKRRQAERVYQETMSLGLEFNKFYRIILTGGGSLLYEKELRELFNDPRLIVKEDAIIANAHGFFLLGNY